MRLQKTNARAMGNAFKVTVDGASRIILCDNGIAAVMRFFNKVRPQVQRINNVDADILRRELETFELIRVFMDDADRIFTYDDLFSEWLSADFAETRKEYEDNFNAYLAECCGKNGTLREV